MRRQIVDEHPGDEESRDDEEHVHADEAAAETRQAGMEGDHSQDCDGSQTVDFASVRRGADTVAEVSAMVPWGSRVMLLSGCRRSCTTSGEPRACWVYHCVRWAGAQLYRAHIVFYASL